MNKTLSQEMLIENTKSDDKQMALSLSEGCVVPVSAELKCSCKNSLNLWR